MILVKKRFRLMFFEFREWSWYSDDSVFYNFSWWFSCDSEIKLKSRDFFFEAIALSSINELPGLSSKISRASFMVFCSFSSTWCCSLIRSWSVTWATYGQHSFWFLDSVWGLTNSTLHKSLAPIACLQVAEQVFDLQFQ